VASRSLSSFYLTSIIQIMSNKKQVEISKQDLQIIYGDDYSFFQSKILPNCYCGRCNTPYTSTIVDYEIYLNALDDVLLSGLCSKCGGRVNRYLETGEVDEYQQNIKKVRRNLKKAEGG